MSLSFFRLAAGYATVCWQRKCWCRSSDLLASLLAVFRGALLLQTRFASDERVYKAFLEILNMYRKGQKTIGNVYEEVPLLHMTNAGALDMLMWRTCSHQPACMHGERPQRHLTVLQVAMLFRSHKDLLEEFPC